MRTQQEGTSTPISADIMTHRRRPACLAWFPEQSMQGKPKSRYDDSYKHPHTRRAGLVAHKFDKTTNSTTIVRENLLRWLRCLRYSPAAYGITCTYWLRGRGIALARADGLWVCVQAWCRLRVFCVPSSREPVFIC